MDAWGAMTRQASVIGKEETVLVGKLVMPAARHTQLKGGVECGGWGSVGLGREAWLGGGGAGACPGEPAVSVNGRQGGQTASAARKRPGRSREQG